MTGDKKNLFKKWPSKKKQKNLPPFVFPTVHNLSSSQKEKKKVKKMMTFGKSLKNDSWDWKFGGLLLKMPYHVLKLSSVRGGG